MSGSSCFHPSQSNCSIINTGCSRNVSFSIGCRRAIGDASIGIPRSSTSRPAWFATGWLRGRSVRSSSVRYSTRSRRSCGTRREHGGTDSAGIRIPWCRWRVSATVFPVRWVECTDWSTSAKTMSPTITASPSLVLNASSSASQQLRRASGSPPAFGTPASPRWRRFFPSCDGWRQCSITRGEWDSSTVSGSMRWPIAWEAMDRPASSCSANFRVRPPDYLPPESGLEARFEEVIALHRHAFRRQVELFDDRGLIGRVDYLAIRRPLVVEVNSERFHTSRTDRAADDDRYERLLASGRSVLVIWEYDVWHRAGQVRRAVASCLTSTDPHPTVHRPTPPPWELLADRSEPST